MTVFRIVMGPLRSAEVGYWVDQKLAGRGIAPTAAAIRVSLPIIVLSFVFRRQFIRGILSGAVKG